MNGVRPFGLDLEGDSSYAGAAEMQHEVDPTINSATEIDTVAIAAKYGHTNDVGMELGRLLKIVDRQFRIRDLCDSHYFRLSS